MTETPDPELVDALAKKNVKMHTKEEEDPREGSKVFHPAAAKALKIKQAVMLDPIEPPKVDESKIEAMVDLTTEVLGEMQSGALSVADKEARGAQLLRQLDISHFRDCLKRSYLDGPGANIAHAQTTVEEARRQNLARQAAGVKNTKELFLKPEPMSVWSSKARAAFESNVFAPESDPQDAMAIDVDGVVGEYKEMKQFLLEGKRIFTPCLLSELPGTAKQEIEIDGMMVNNTHPEFKLAVLTHTSSQFGPPPIEDRAHSLQSSGVGTPEEPMGSLTTTTTPRLQALPVPPPTEDSAHSLRSSGGDPGGSEGQTNFYSNFEDPSLAGPYSVGPPGFQSSSLT